MDLKASARSPARCGEAASWGRGDRGGPQDAKPATVLRLVLISLGLLAGMRCDVQRLPGLAFSAAVSTGHVPPDRHEAAGWEPRPGRAPGCYCGFLLRTLQLARSGSRDNARCIQLVRFERTWLRKSIRTRWADSLASTLPAPGHAVTPFLDILVLLALVPAAGKGWWCTAVCRTVLGTTGIGKVPGKRSPFIVQYTLLFVARCWCLQLWGLDSVLPPLVRQCVSGWPWALACKAHHQVTHSVPDSSLRSRRSQVGFVNRRHSGTVQRIAYAAPRSGTWIALEDHSQLRISSNLRCVN